MYKLSQSIQKTPLFKTADFSRGEYICLDLNEYSGAFPDELFNDLNDIDPYLLSRYPEYDILEGRIAENNGVSTNEVCLFNGSDAGISALIRLLATNAGPDEVLMMSPTFGIYDLALSHLGVEPKRIHYTADDALRSGIALEKVRDAISQDTRLLLVCNPNNPLGLLHDNEYISSLIKHCFENDVYVIVDEAYFEFCGQSSVDQLSHFPNLIILRTFSKSYGLAGLRIGYILGHETLMQELTKIRLPWGVSSFSVLAATAALKYSHFFENERIKIATRRNELAKHLESLGIIVYPSFTNFILAKHSRYREITAFMKDNGVLIKNMHSNNDEEILVNAMRITIPSADDLAVVKSLFTDFFKKFHDAP